MLNLNYQGFATRPVLQVGVDLEPPCNTFGGEFDESNQAGSSVVPADSSFDEGMDVWMQDQWVWNLGENGQTPYQMLAKGFPELGPVDLRFNLVAWHDLT